MKTKTILAGLLAFGAMGLASTGSASAGEWRLDPMACPDLREDFRDSRVDYGRADRREDRRDARNIDCPPRAFYYVPDRWERKRGIEGPRHGRFRHVFRTRSGQIVGVTRRGERVRIYMDAPRYAYRDGYRGRDRYDRGYRRDRY